MSVLEECRKEIDQIDSKIIELYEKRMSVVKKVLEFKKENNMQVFDSSREASMLDKNLAKISNEEYKKYYKSVLDGFLKSSKDMQNDLLNK